MPIISRTTKTKVLTIASGANLSDAFDMRDFAAGNIYMPAAWTSASIGFKISPSEGGTFLPIYDHTDTIIEIDGPSVDQAYNLPPEMFPAGWVKLWSQDGAGGDTNQAAERSITIELKS